MADLSLVPIDDMVAEIKRRSTAVVLAYVLNEHGCQGAIFSYDGGFTACIGLLTRFLWQFHRDDTQLTDRIEGTGDER